ncbi:MAG: PAS domain-containing protein [Bilophila sp.]
MRRTSPSSTCLCVSPCTSCAAAASPVRSLFSAWRRNGWRLSTRPSWRPLTTCGFLLSLPRGWPRACGGIWPPSRNARTGGLQKVYLNTTIDSIPNLVWFKDVGGAHLKVNDAFCDAVGKTKRQIEGRGHYYIWDLKKEEYEKGEYVCLETDDTVLEKGRTCLFDEMVKSRRGMLQFKTYKSPLFDEDGAIMGTVGIAHDVTALKNMDVELEIILGSIPFAVLIRDAAGRVVKVNAKLGDYFQIAAEKITGSDYADWKRAALGESLPRGAGRQQGVHGPAGRQDGHHGNPRGAVA